MKNVPWPMVVGPVLTGIALMVLGLVLFARAPSPVQANGPSTVGLVAVDTNIAGNGVDLNEDGTSSPPAGGNCADGIDNDEDGLIDSQNDPECNGLTAALGTIEGCGEIASVGDTLQIDVIVDEVPADLGTSGFDFKLTFDPAVVHVTASSTGVSLVTLDPDSGPFFPGQATSTTGILNAGLADFGGAIPGIAVPPFVAGDGNASETGPGVLVRLTLTAQAAGISGLNLSEVGVGDGYGNPITIDAVQDAKVAVGEPCPTVNTAPVAQDIKIGVPLGSVGYPWWPEVSDPQGDAVTCSLVGGTSSNSSVAGTSAEGGEVAISKDCSTGSYTPPADFTAGIDSFEYEVTDAVDSGEDLAEDLDAVETDVDVTNATPFTVGNLIRVDDELMEITSIGGNTLTVIRGVSGTTATTHASGADVLLLKAVDSGEDLAEALDTIETDVDVTDGTAFDVGHFVLVDKEIMEITAKAGNTLTVDRGVSGTTATTHASGSDVQLFDIVLAVDTAIVTVVVGPDTDGDATIDSLDLCPDTPEDEEADDKGCSASQVDLDADGICDPDAPSRGPAVETIAALSEGLDDSATDVEVSETTPFSVGSLILVNDEIMEITSITPTETGGTLTVVRGVSGTTAAAHGIGVPIFSPPSSCTGSDNCPDVINPKQKDSDGDGVGDLCEPVVATATPTVTPTVAAAAEPEATPPSEVPSTGFGPLSGGTDWTAIVLTVAGLVLVLGGLASPFAYRAIRRRNS